MVTRCDMKAPIATTHGAEQCCPIGDISNRAFKLCAGQSAHVGAGAEKSAHAVAACIQLMNEIRPNKT